MLTALKARTCYLHYIARDQLCSRQHHQAPLPQHCGHVSLLTGSVIDCSMACNGRFSGAAQVEHGTGMCGLAQDCKLGAHGSKRRRSARPLNPEPYSLNPAHLQGGHLPALQELCPAMRQPQPPERLLGSRQRTS